MELHSNTAMKKVEVNSLPSLNVQTDDTSHTVYCKVYDGEFYSDAVSNTYTADSTPPIMTLDSVSGDTSPSYWDDTDNGNTYIDVDLSENGTTCKWSYSNQAYGSMANTCVTSVADIQCDLGDLNERRDEVVYIGCIDSVGNIQTTNLEVTFGVDFTDPSTYITNTTGGTTTGIHLPGYQIVLTENDVPVENVPDNIYTWNCTGSGCSITESPSTGSIDNGTIVTFNARGTNVFKYYSKDDAGHQQSPPKEESIIINSLPVITDDDLNFGIDVGDYTGKYGKRVYFYCDGTDPNTAVDGNAGYSAKIWLKHSESGTWDQVNGAGMTWLAGSGKFMYDHLLDDFDDRYGKIYDMKCEITDDVGESSNHTKNSIFTVFNTAPNVDDITVNDTGVQKFDSIKWTCIVVDADGSVHYGDNQDVKFWLAYRGQGGIGNWSILDNVPMTWDGDGNYVYEMLMTDDGGTYYDAQCQAYDGVDYSTLTQELDTEYFVVDDWDGDGTSDSLDALEGTGNDLNTSLSGVSILIDGIIDNDPNGSKRVTFEHSGEEFVSFTHDFDLSELIAPDITVERSTTETGSVLVKGLAGVSKTLRVPKVVGANMLCVKNAEVSSINEISTMCNGADESYFDACDSDGQTIGSITCTDNTTYYELTGLTNSAAKEFGTARLEIDSSGTYLQLDIINFYANYTNSTSGAAITGADCNIWFSDSGWVDMNFDNTLWNYGMKLY